MDKMRMIDFQSLSSAGVGFPVAATTVEVVDEFHPPSWKINNSVAKGSDLVSLLGML